MTIRSRQSRRDWWPAQRIPELKRYAFIGDSTMYGVGVKPDEALPAVAERQLNEALPAWPVEAVNYGVSGYNIWNSWIGIKPLLPMFDGLVLALCSNDAEMFSRTYKVLIPDGRYISWEPEDPFGAAAAACFAEIARSCKALALPVMVVYYNAHKVATQMRVHEIIAGHCADNGIDYIHTLPLYAARNLSLDQLIVSAADGHPSALAHDLVARHLVSEMSRLGWFRDMDEKASALAPARLSQAADTMMAAEHYPADAAFGWALHAMEAKTRVARRRAALEGDNSFEPLAAPVRATLQANAEAWHVARRAEACVLEQTNQSQLFSGNLLALQLTRLRLEEIGFAMTAESTLPALARLQAPPDLSTPAPPASEPPAFFAQTRAVLAAEMAALSKLGQMSSAAAVAVAPLRRFVALLDAETQALNGAVAQANMLAKAITATLPPAQRQTVLALLRDDIGVIGKRLANGCALTSWAARVERRLTVPYTKVVAVLRTGTLNGVSGMFSLRAEYTIPHRMPFVANMTFHTEPQPVTLTFYMPLLYAGRVTLASFGGPGARTPEVIEILQFTLSNAPGVQRSVPPATLHCGEPGNWTSPLIFLV